MNLFPASPRVVPLLAGPAHGLLTVSGAIRAAAETSAPAHAALALSPTGPTLC